MKSIKPSFTETDVIISAKIPCWKMMNSIGLYEQYKSGVTATAGLNSRRWQAKPLTSSGRLRLFTRDQVWHNLRAGQCLRRQKTVPWSCPTGSVLYVLTLTSAPQVWFPLLGGKVVWHCTLQVGRMSPLPTPHPQWLNSYLCQQERSLIFQLNLGENPV